MNIGSSLIPINIYNINLCVKSYKNQGIEFQSNKLNINFNSVIIQLESTGINLN